MLCRFVGQLNNGGSAEVIGEMGGDLRRSTYDLSWDGKRWRAGKTSYHRKARFAGGRRAEVGGGKLDLLIPISLEYLYKSNTGR